MRKHLATMAGLALALAFVVLFFNGRYESKPLSVVAPRVGLKARRSARNGSAHRLSDGCDTRDLAALVYLMACSGVPTSATLEAHAKQAADIAEQRRLTPREAATSVLNEMRSTDGASALRDC
jgi:hypothetical protein